MGLLSTQETFDFWGYFRDIWNKMDMLFLGLALVAFVLRFFKETFWVRQNFINVSSSAFADFTIQFSRIVFAYNAGVLLIRLTRFHHASRTLGPRIIALGKIVCMIQVKSF